MKTTLFISAALLFSMASFAQTSAKNSEAVRDATALRSDKTSSQVKTSGSVSSASSVQSNAVPATESKVGSKVEKLKEAIAAEKQETMAKAKTEEQETKKAASPNASVSAGTQSNSQVAIAAKGNKINEKASINSRATLSSAKAKTAGNQLNEESKTAVAHAAKPKPAPIKMNAKVKSNTAIRIK